MKKIAGVFLIIIILIVVNHALQKTSPVSTPLLSVTAQTSDIPTTNQTSLTISPAPTAVNTLTNPDRSGTAKNLTGHSAIGMAEDGNYLANSQLPAKQRPLVLFSRTNGNFGESRQITVIVGE